MFKKNYIITIISILILSISCGNQMTDANNDGNGGGNKGNKDNTNGNGKVKITNLTVYCGSNSLGIDTNSDYSQDIKNLWLSVTTNKDVTFLFLNNPERNEDGYIDGIGDFYDKNKARDVFKKVITINSNSALYSISKAENAKNINKNYIGGIYYNGTGLKPQYRLIIIDYTLDTIVFYVFENDNIDIFDETSDILSIGWKHSKKFFTFK